MKQTFSLRPAHPGDIEAASALLRQAALAPLDAPADQFAAQYIVALDPSETVIAAAGLEIHGSCALLRSVVVSPAWQSHGIGQQLATALIERARASSVRAVFLLTTTAAAYWQRRGFAVVDRHTAPAAIQQTQEWRTGCPSSATAMRLPL